VYFNIAAAFVSSTAFVIHRLNPSCSNDCEGLTDKANRKKLNTVDRLWTCFALADSVYGQWQPQKDIVLWWATGSERSVSAKK
jgi:hypothetical protein